MATEGFYQKHRPAKLDDVVGQATAVKTIRGFGKKIPHAILFQGGSGCGKTTLARIVARMLGCPPENKFDYAEMNCGVVESAIDMVRDIQHAMTASPMGGDKRVWVLDEVQALSRAKHAQEALLKILEDGPGHVHFMLCTTDPKKILPTIRNRCTPITCNSIADRDLTTLVKRVAAAESVKLTDDVIEKIVSVAAGSGRAALVALEAVCGIESADDQLAAVDVGRAEKVAFDLVRELMPFNGTPSWAGVAKVLADIREEDPEGIRQMVLASARTTLLKGGKTAPHAYRVIVSLSEPMYDRASGHALLAAYCYEVINGRPK